MICHDVLNHRVEITFTTPEATEDGFTCVIALEMLTCEPLHDALALGAHAVQALGHVLPLALAAHDRISLLINLIVLI